MVAARVDKMPILMLLQRTWFLTLRHFALLYPFTLFILFGMVAAQPMADSPVPVWSARFLIFMVWMLVVQATFEAGWVFLIARRLGLINHEATMGKPVTTPVPVATPREGMNLPNPMGAINVFMEGVGRYALTFVGAEILFGLLLVGLVALGVWLLNFSGADWQFWSVWVQKLSAVMQRQLPENATQADTLGVVLTNLRALPRPRLNQLQYASQLFMILGATYGLFRLLTQYWAGLVVLKKYTVFRAWGESIRLSFKHPVVLIALLTIDLFLTLNGLLLEDVPVLGLLGQLFSLVCVLWLINSQLMVLYYWDRGQYPLGLPGFEQTPPSPPPSQET